MDDDVPLMVPALIGTEAIYLLLPDGSIGRVWYNPIEVEVLPVEAVAEIMLALAGEQIADEAEAVANGEAL